MHDENPVSLALRLYLRTKGIKGTARGIKNTFIREKNTLEQQSEQRKLEAEKLFNTWDLYRTGNIKESKIQQLRTAAGTTLSGASAFQRSMTTNYMLASLPMLAASTVKGGADLLNKFGVESNLINSIGSTAGNIASSIAPAANVFRYAQYINPVYAATSIASSKMFGAIGSLVGGNQFLMQMIAPYAAMFAYPLINKVTDKIVKVIAGGSISRKRKTKLKPITIDAKLHSMNDFINQSPIQEANNLINQLYALDPDQKSIDPVQTAQLQFLAEITAYTSSIPVLTSEIINNFIKKDTVSALAYNKNLSKLKTFYKGKDYRDVIEKHADRVEHGKFAHTFTENIGLAATEFSSFLHKMSVMLDPIKQIQMVLSGKNIKDEIKKFDKAFQSIEQRKSAIFAKKMGIGEEESYVNMYFSLTEDSQSILSRAKSFEDAQIGLLAGIYEFTRLTALETATLRTKAYGIKEPVKYNIIGKVDAQAKGLINWLSNKIPMFEFVRTVSSGVLNVARILVDKYLPDDEKSRAGRLKKAIQFVIGGPRVFRYQDEILNKMAEGFNARRYTTLFERITEPFIDKLNEKLLEIPVLRIFANKDRMSLEKRAKLKYQEEMAKEFDAILKEMGVEKLEDQQLYYRYATTTMPEQFDLMVHHLSNIALFTHATMLNTAALSKTLAGSAHVAKPNENVKRTINRYTGKLETDEEAESFRMALLNSAVNKALENAKESEKSWSRLWGTAKQAFGKYDENEIKKQLLKGILEGSKFVFERERNTAEQSWDYIFKMTHRPLFTQDFLKKVEDDKNFAKNILEGKIDKEDLIAIGEKYGINEYSKNKLAELESQMLKVDVARISAPELLEVIEFRNRALLTNQTSKPGLLNEIKLLKGKVESIGNTATENASTVIKPLLEQPGWRAAALNPDAETYTGMRRSTFFGKLSADNTIEGSKKAHENELLDLEEKQTEKLSGIKKILSDIKKLFTVQQAVNAKNSHVLDSDDEADDDDSYFDWPDSDKDNRKRKRRRSRRTRRPRRRSFSRSIKNGFRRLGRFAKSGLRTVGRTALRLGTNLITRAAPAALEFIGGITAGTAAIGAAAAGAVGYGIYNASYGREKALIDKLEQQGIVEHNFFGNSKILDWDAVRKLPLDQLTQLLSFDDWSDEDKKVLQELVSQKTKEKTILDAQRKNVFKNQKEFNKFIEQRDKEIREKEGFIGYWLSRGVRAVRHGVDSVLTLGGRFGLGDKKDRELYEKLEKAGIIEYSTMPFVKSKIRDWDTITKLDAYELKSLLKLNWDDDTKKQLEEILNAREKQKMAALTQIQFKNVFKNQKDFDKFVKDRDKELREKRGFLGYWAKKASRSASHLVQNVLTLGGRFGLGNSKDRELYEKLEKAGVIEYSIIPFMRSEILDWDTIVRLSPDQLKLLLNLTWDEKTKSYLKEILDTKLKQKTGATEKQKQELKQKTEAATSTTQTSVKDKVHGVFSSVKNLVSKATDKAKNFASNAVSSISNGIHSLFGSGKLDELLTDLSDKGIITKTPQGIKITDWDKIYDLSADKIKSLIQYSDYVNADTIKQKLQAIYNSKIGKQIADERNSKNIPNPMKSKVDLDTVVSATSNQSPAISYVEELFSTLASKLDELIAVTAAGHAKQVAATLQVAKNQNSNDNDGPKHPLTDN